MEPNAAEPLRNTSILDCCSSLFRYHTSSFSDAPSCLECGIKFSMKHRRHHCRYCGRTCCRRCLPHRLAIPEYGLKKPSPVCGPCRHVLLALNNPANTSEIDDSKNSLYSPPPSSPLLTREQHDRIILQLIQPQGLSRTQRLQCLCRLLGCDFNDGTLPLDSQLQLMFLQLNSNRPFNDVSFSESVPQKKKDDFSHFSGDNNDSVLAVPIADVESIRKAEDEDDEEEGEEWVFVSPIPTPGTLSIPPKLIGTCSSFSDILSQSTELLHDLMESLPLCCTLSEEWGLLFSTGLHGISLGSFFNNVESHDNVLILARSSDGICFGAFSPVAIHMDNNPRYYGSREMFVFTTASGTFKKYAWSRQNDYFLLTTQRKIVIGGGEKGGALCFDCADGLSAGSTNACDTFDSPHLLKDFQNRSAEIIPDSHEFQLQSLEVWWLQPPIGKFIVPAFFSCSFTD